MWRAKEVKCFRVIMESPLMSPVEKNSRKSCKSVMGLYTDGSGHMKA